MGHNFGTDAHKMYHAEVDYLIKQEYVTSAEDILWRRTKLGLYINSLDKINELDNYIKKYILSISI